MKKFQISPPKLKSRIFTMIITKSESKARFHPIFEALSILIPPNNPNTALMSSKIIITIYREPCTGDIHEKSAPKPKRGRTTIRERAENTIINQG